MKLKVKIVATLQRGEEEAEDIIPNKSFPIFRLVFLSSSFLSSFFLLLFFLLSQIFLSYLSLVFLLYFFYLIFFSSFSEISLFLSVSTLIRSFHIPRGNSIKAIAAMTAEAASVAILKIQ